MSTAVMSPASTSTLQHLPTTPVPEEADTDRMRKYMNDRRVIGVRRLSSTRPLHSLSAIASSSTYSASCAPNVTSITHAYMHTIANALPQTPDNTPQYDPLIQPALIRHEIKSSSSAQSTIARTRWDASRIIAGEDDRLIVVVGPCSIHSPEQALEYAKMLKEDIPKWDGLLIIMRAYL